MHRNLTLNSNPSLISKEKLFNLLLSAAGYDELEKITELWNANLEHKQYFLELKSYWLARHASEFGASRVLNFLLAQASLEQKKEILEAKDYYAFCSAAQGGHEKNIQLLWEQTSDTNLRSKMFCAREYYAFGSALRQDRLKVIKFLWLVANDEEKNIILEKMLSKKPEWSPHKLSTASLREVINFIADNVGEELAHLVKKLPNYFELRNMPDVNTFFQQDLRVGVGSTPENTIITDTKPPLTPK